MNQGTGSFMNMEQMGYGQLPGLPGLPGKNLHGHVVKTDKVNGASFTDTCMLTNTPKINNRFRLLYNFISGCAGEFLMS